MKTLDEIYSTLSNLNALTKGSFVKAAKAAGHEKTKIESFWIFSQPQKVERVTMASLTREAIIESPNISKGEMIAKLNQLGEMMGRTANPSWPQARSYFLDQWEIAKAVYQRYSTPEDEDEAEDQVSTSDEAEEVSTSDEVKEDQTSDEVETKEDQVSTSDEVETKEDQVSTSDEVETKEDQVSTSDEVETKEDQVSTSDEVETKEDQ